MATYVIQQVWTNFKENTCVFLKGSKMHQSIHGFGFSV